MKKSTTSLIILLTLICFALTGCTIEITTVPEQFNTTITEHSIKNEVSNITNNSTIIESFNLDNIPEFNDKPYVVINDNKPFFKDEDLSTESYEKYSELDSLGRCSVAIANIGKDLMPTEDRESIGSVKPSGWQTVKYAGIDGNYLYNRCHLIGFQLTGENANKGNLITGTRYLNVDGMLPFENMIADYIKEYNNHVLYRVTPIFKDDNLVASGVLMEAKSVEDKGQGIEFNVYCYNNQPGVTINYKTGESTGPEYTGTQSSNQDNIQNDTSTATYILNTNSKKIHKPDCSNALDIKEKNKEETNKTKDQLIKDGYSTCGLCKP